MGESYLDTFVIRLKRTQQYQTIEMITAEAAEECADLAGGSDFGNNILLSLGSI